MYYHAAHPEASGHEQTRGKISVQNKCIMYELVTCTEKRDRTMLVLNERRDRILCFTATRGSGVGVTTG